MNHQANLVKVCEKGSIDICRWLIGFVILILLILLRMSIKSGDEIELQ